MWFLFAAVKQELSCEGNLFSYWKSPVDVFPTRAYRTRKSSVRVFQLGLRSAIVQVFQLGLRNAILQVFQIGLGNTIVLVFQLELGNAVVRVFNYK